MKPSPGPKKLNTLFDRYKKILRAPEQSVVTAATEVIEELLAITIPAQQITYSAQTRTLHIKNGLIRSAILPHKNELLAHLQGRLGVKSAPKDIR